MNECCLGVSAAVEPERTVSDDSVKVRVVTTPLEGPRTSSRADIVWLVISRKRGGYEEGLVYICLWAGALAGIGTSFFWTSWAPHCRLPRW